MNDAQEPMGKIINNLIRLQQVQNIGNSDIENEDVKEMISSRFNDAEVLEKRIRKNIKEFNEKHGTNI